MAKSPLLLVMAGPNGSGKSTITAKFPLAGSYVNADLIQRHLRCTPLEAAQIAEKTREALLSSRADFTIETVLSTDRNYSLMRRARDCGYHVCCIFVLTKDPAINLARVIRRIENGGNEAPLDKIKTRYCRALKLLPNLFHICQEVFIYDNSPERAEGEPSLVVSMQNGKLQTFPSNIWPRGMIKKLLEGTYAEQFEENELL